MPKVKNAFFAFIAIFLIPLLFFVLLELGLRALGVGKSFDYFHKMDINGRPHYQENPAFAYQFYPPSLNPGYPFPTPVKPTRMRPLGIWITKTAWDTRQV